MRPLLLSLALCMCSPGHAADGVQDRPAADAALNRDEQLLMQPQLPVLEQRAALRRLAEGAMARRDFAKAADSASRYLKLGGNDPDVKALLTVALYRSKRYADAARALQSEIYAAEHTGQAPSEERLRWLLDCYEQLGDKTGARWVLGRLVVHHTKREYWMALLQTVEVPERLRLDVQRLRLATDSMVTAGDYIAMADLAGRQGWPGEARKVLDAGFAAGVLGAGADAARHRQLREQAARHAADDLQRLSAPEAEARARAESDGLALVTLGFGFITHGQSGKGIPLMEAGLRKGVHGIPQDSKIRLAIAYLWSGQKTKAMELLRTVAGRHGAGDVARLWEWFILTAEPGAAGSR